MHIIPVESQRKKKINFLINKYNFLKVEYLGKSWCERDIIGLKTGNSKEMVLLVGAFHGMEWMTSLLLFKFLEDVCNVVKANKLICGVNISEKIKNRGIFVIPCINPDGVEIFLKGSSAAYEYKKVVEKSYGKKNHKWQSNARGVDLNHNFKSGWEELKKLEIKNNIVAPSWTRYGGEFPESERETQAITRLCRNSNFKRAFAFHSQGEEIYWDYNNQKPENSEFLAMVFALSSGYELNRPEGLAVGGGFKDWFITEFNRPAFTIEIGKGKNPLPLQCFNHIYNKILPMLWLSILI